MSKEEKSCSGGGKIIEMTGAMYIYRKVKKTCGFYKVYTVNKTWENIWGYKSYQKLFNNPNRL